MGKRYQQQHKLQRVRLPNRGSALVDFVDQHCGRRTEQQGSDKKETERKLAVLASLSIEHIESPQIKGYGDLEDPLEPVHGGLRYAKSR